MLCVGLAQEGTVITGNRTKVTALLNSNMNDISGESPVSDSLAEDHSDPA